jgi:hypothetical protein
MSVFGNSSRRCPLWVPAGLVAVVVLAGCGDDASSSASPDPHAVPTAAADCNDLGAHRGDGFVLAGTDWSAEPHDYGEAAVVHACVQPGIGGTVSLEVTGHGITVTPRSRAADSSASGVLAFRVRVTRGATGRLTMHQQSAGAETGGPGPEVVAGADGWHFTAAG